MSLEIIDTHNRDRAEVAVSQQNTNLKALKAVKLAIALVCVTGGVVAGTNAHAATKQRTDYEGVPLTLINDTSDEVVLFLHEDGDKSAYTRFANMPPCTERTLGGSYGRGWKVSQNLNTPVRINQVVTSGNKIYTTSINKKETKHQCVKDSPTENPERIALVHAGQQGGEEERYATVNVGFGWLTSRRVNEPVEQVAKGFSKRVSGVVAKSNEALAATLKEVENLDGGREAFFKFVAENGPGEVRKKYGNILDPEFLSAISLGIKEQSKDTFIEEYKRAFTIANGTDSVEEIGRKGEEFYELVKNSNGDLVNLEAFFTVICDKKLSPEQVRILVARLVKLVSIAEKQNMMPIDAVVGEETGKTTKSLLQYYEAASKEEKETIRKNLCPAKSGRGVGRGRMGGEESMSV
jgi:hypothetical protein